MADRHFMNPSVGRHLGQQQEPEPNEHADGEEGSEHKPSIHIHSHSKGHTVHIMHKDGTHEKHEHGPGDAEGIAQHIHEQLGTPGSMNEGQSDQGQAGY
jgi:hypothetical protein